ncbi:MAG: NAD(P)-binding domain-containing protein, partial [Acidobacteriota bacterium]
MIDLSTAASQPLKQRIEARTARVGIIGMGYVGLPLALLFNEQGFAVVGFDVDELKVSRLNAGQSYIVRIPGSEIEQARTRGFSATGDYSRIGELDAIIICVPTPLDDFHQPDLSYIAGTARAIAPHLRAGQLVILESTTYPGTTEEVLIPLLESGNA